MPRFYVGLTAVAAGLVVTLLANARGQDSCRASADALDCESVIADAIGSGLKAFVVVLVVWGFAEIVLGGDTTAGRATQTSVGAGWLPDLALSRRGRP